MMPSANVFSRFAQDPQQMNPVATPRRPIGIQQPPMWGSNPPQFPGFGHMQPVGGPPQFGGYGQQQPAGQPPPYQGPPLPQMPPQGGPPQAIIPGQMPPQGGPVQMPQGFSPMYGGDPMQNYLRMRAGL